MTFTFHCLTIYFTSWCILLPYPFPAMAASNEQVVSPVDTEKPHFIISAQSINAEPVELDSTPTSPEKLRARRASRDEVLAELGEEEKKVGSFSAVDEPALNCDTARLSLTSCIEARPAAHRKEERSGRPCRHTANS